MADKKISELTGMTASEIANDDNIVIADTSDNHTKRAPISELATFFGVNTEGIQDTVGSMFTGHSSHSGITPVYDDPNGHIIFSLAGGVTTAEMGFLAGTTSDIQTQLDAKAPIASPTFTGTPSAPTASANTVTTQVATTEYVASELGDYASDTVTFTNKSGNISQWTNDSVYVTPSSTATFTNKSGNISQWTNNSNYLTPDSTNTLTNKSINGSNNTITDIPYSAITSIVDTDITSVSASDDELASSKAIKTYVDSQISGIDTLAEAGDSNISSPSAGQILVHDGTDSFDNQTSTVTLSGAVTGTADMDSSGDFAITTTIPTDTITINGQAVALGGSATIPSVLQSGGTFTGELHLNDDVELSFGGGIGSGDFRIKHDSSSNKTIFAESGAGELEIQASDFVVKNGANNKTMINAEDGGSVELFENNTKVFETSATGVDVTGNIVVSGTVDGVDIGALNTAVGNLATVATTGLYSDLSGSPTLATVATSGAYSDLSGTPTLATVATSGAYSDLSGTPTFATVATSGAYSDLSGTPSAIGGANAVNFNDNVKATFGDSSDLEIYHDGTNSFIKDVGTGGLFLRGDTVLSLGVGSESAVRCTINSDVKLYYDDALKFSTTSQGVQVAADQRLEIVNGSNWSGEVVGKIEHHSNNMYHQYNSNWIARNSSGTNTLTIDSSGNGTFNGNVTAYSDSRLKENIKTIDNALDKVSKLRGVEYTRKETEAREIGVIAQEVKEIVPELVTIENLKSDINPDALEDMHTMKYGNTVGLLIEAIKQLKDRNEKLELIVNRLITEVEEK